MYTPLSIGATVDVYSTLEVTRALERLSPEPGNIKLRRLYTKMLETGSSRLLSKPSSSKGLSELAALCPNFEKVTLELSKYVELANLGNKPVNVIPVLLAGSPGVGKTHFAKCLANALGVPSKFVSMSTMTAGWTLSGAAPGWAGARHGKIAEAIIEGHIANPLFLLEEIDKTGGDARFDPYGALLQLMERDTAKHFTDEFLDLEVNASTILWVATANNLAAIPDYILSRMAVFEVPSPTPDQARVIINNIYASLHKEHPAGFEESLAEDTATAFLRIAPREMHKALLSAMGNAVVDNRRVVLPQDVPLSASKQGLGFLA